jgi:hypothetical protein
MVRQGVYSQEGELTMSLPVGEVSATTGAPSMDVDRRRLQEEIVDLLGDGSTASAPRSWAWSRTTRPRRCGSPTAGRRRATSSSRPTGSTQPSATASRSVPASDLLVRPARGHLRLRPPLAARRHHVQVWGRGRRAGIGAVSEGRARWFFGGVLRPDEPDIEPEEMVRRAEGLPDIVAGVVAASDPSQIVRARIAHAYPVEHWRDGPTPTRSRSAGGATSG